VFLYLVTILLFISWSDFGAPFSAILSLIFFSHIFTFCSVIFLLTCFFTDFFHAPLLFLFLLCFLNHPSTFPVTPLLVSSFLQNLMPFDKSFFQSFTFYYLTVSHKFSPSLL
jgi:hypothetical protein